MARRLAWSDHIFDGTTIPAGAQQNFNLLADAPVNDNQTVERILIDFWVFAGPTNENEGMAQISCGIGVTSQDAATATIFPDPQQQADYPPRGWVYVATQPAFNSIPGGGTPGGIWHLDAHFKADIRTRRKVDKGQLFLVLNNVTISGDLTCFRIGRVRTLCRT